jgi:hypothetical protein
MTGTGIGRRHHIITLLTMIVLFSSLATAGQDDSAAREQAAMRMMEQDGIYFYFPPGESYLAQRLAADCGAMISFLADRGLPPAKPLHIVLDDGLDAPRVRVRIIPHHEIRIPLKAPGVLEDGFLESDPWRYFLFLGLSTQGIFGERSGIPKAFHYVFGEGISPNVILPEWTIDGISHLLYDAFEQRASVSPLDRAIMLSSPIPKLDKVSNHPEVWPGRFSYRIYGRPFIRWLDERYGWDKILAFLRVHGGGVIPIEIERKAREVFDAYPAQLWNRFRNELSSSLTDGVVDKPGLPMTGYWPAPFIHWNDNGVYPGLVRKADRSRYGYVDENGWLRTSRYVNGVLWLTGEHRDTLHTLPRPHVWDPGPGAVAVTRKGRRPYLVMHTPSPNSSAAGKPGPPERLIPGPPGVMQLSGPVAAANGRVAVAGNTGGNWDIWLFDDAWHRVTTADSVELDPWFDHGRIIFSSNISGRFQIYNENMQPLTNSPTAAMLPRSGMFLQLGGKGWFARPYASVPVPIGEAESAGTASPPPETLERHSADISDYSIFPSILPNYLGPDIFADADNFQFGIATRARDVSRFFGWDAGVRYAADNHKISWRLGGEANGYSTRATYYRFSYTSANGTSVNENRYEIKASWSPSWLADLAVGVNWRRYAPVKHEESAEHEWWGSLNYIHSLSHLNTNATLDWFADDSRSLYGEVRYWFGEKINTIIRVQAGKTWGDLAPGHNSFRIGGSVGEGAFTRRSSRLFPVRGFDANSLDAEQAAAIGIEVFWPLARLQRGYHTLPLFLHNISLGTFVDSGLAAEHPEADDILAGAGIELITGMELAWGFMSNFRLGLAWPLRGPDSLDQEGPVFLIQIGRPL